MKVLAAYLLSVLGGNANPTVEDIKKILGSVGIDADEGRISLLTSQLAGKDITEVIASGRDKLASVPSGGGGGAVAAPVVSGGAGGGSATPAAEEPKKEEKVEEESEEDMVFGLFD